MAEKLLKYDVAMKSTKTVWQMDIPRANTGDENTVTFDFNITDLDSAELTGATPNVNLYMRDGSFFQCRPEEGVELNGQRVTYTMRENEGKHNGKAKAELVLIWPGTNPIQKLTSQQYAFEIANGLDTVVAVEVMIQDWTTLAAEAQVYLDQMAEKHAIADADHTRAETDHTTALADHAVTADMILNGTNLVTNGDFSNGTTGWSANFADLSVVNGEMIVTLTENNVSSGIHRFNTDIPAGNKFYASADIFTTYAGAVKIGFLNNFDTKSVAAGQYNKISALRSMGEYNIFTIYHDATGAYVIGDTFKIKNAFVIDLTATFGAGNEPTDAQMDRLLKQFPNSWFDGTENLFLAKWALDELRRLDDEKANKVQEAWITPTFLNGWTEVSGYPVRYMKDETGFVHIKGKVTGGTVGLRAFTLPSGYRCLEAANKFALPNDGNTISTGQIQNDGAVAIVFGSGVNVSLVGIVPFRAEQ